MARLRDVVMDCSHPASLARFWAEVLDGYAVAPYDDEELARLRTIGVLDPEDDPTVLVEPALGEEGIRYFFIKVPEPKTVKNRLHLDLVADDHEIELDRLLGLGARVVWTLPDNTTLADPEGNEFCLMR